MHSFTRNKFLARDNLEDWIEGKTVGSFLINSSFVSHSLRFTLSQLVWENFHVFVSPQFSIFLFSSNPTLCIGLAAYKTNPLKKGLCKHVFTNHSPFVHFVPIYIMKENLNLFHFLIGVTSCEKEEWWMRFLWFTIHIQTLCRLTLSKNKSTCYITIDLNNKGIKFIYLCACFSKLKPYMLCIIAPATVYD